MKNIGFKNGMLPAILIATAAMAFNACSDKDEPNDEPAAKATYALLTGDMTQAPYAGYLTPHQTMPSGAVDNIKTASLSAHVNGMRFFGKWIC